MDLQIRNFGAIENADVKFDGLTVIAGENDTGKSTVGKLVFSVIKAINRYEQDLEVNKEQNVRGLIEQLYLKLRKSTKKESFKKLSTEFSPKNFFNELRPYVIKQPSLFQDFLFDNEGIEQLFNRKKDVINVYVNSKYEGYAREDILKILSNIQIELTKEENKSEILKKALKRAFVAEFYGEVSPKNCSKQTTIHFNEGANKLFEIKANKNVIDDFKIYDEITEFEDVTFIESPIIVQLFDAINQSRTIFELNREELRDAPQVPNVSLHVKDLMDKITNSSELADADLLDEKQKKIINNIQEVIQGNWVFDRKKRDFIFSKKEKNGKKFQVRSVNTASGIKSFGIIQLLLLSEILNNRSLLIIDEPETHLHPKWQVEYAKIICLLVKHEIPVLVTSHSPYLIQALRHYSEEYGIERFTNYYLAERNDNGLVDIENVNNDLNRVFLKLSQPLHDLVWK